MRATAGTANQERTEYILGLGKQLSPYLEDVLPTLCQHICHQLQPVQVVLLQKSTLQEIFKRVET